MVAFTSVATSASPQGKFQTAAPRILVGRRLGWLAAVLVVLAPGLHGQSAPPATPPLGAQPGELLTFSATWRLWHAGDATVRFEDVGPNRRVIFHAESAGIASVLFPVHDHSESLYAPQAFCTLQVIKDTSEGRRKRHTAILYHPEQQQLVLDEQNLSAKPVVSKHEVKPIPGCVLDLFSSLAYVRSLPLAVGEVYNCPVNDGGQTAEVRVVADLKERIVTPAGAFATIRTEPTVFNNQVFQRSGKMWVWFSDDARHLPVKIQAKVSWGTITALLTKVQER